MNNKNEKWVDYLREKATEPEAHCYDCPNRHGKCAEYAALNPGSLKLLGKPYDRGHCHWGYETIQKERNKKGVEQ